MYVQKYVRDYGCSSLFVRFFLLFLFSPLFQVERKHLQPKTQSLFIMILFYPHNLLIACCPGKLVKLYYVFSHMTTRNHCYPLYLLLLLELLLLLIFLLLPRHPPLYKRQRNSFLRYFRSLVQPTDNTCK